MKKNVTVFRKEQWVELMMQTKHLTVRVVFRLDSQQDLEEVIPSSIHCSIVFRGYDISDNMVAVTR